MWDNHLKNEHFRNADMFKTIATSVRAADVRFNSIFVDIVRVTKLNTYVVWEIKVI